MKTCLQILTLALCAQALAQDTGNVIPFQGQLANQSGQPLTPASPSTLVFRLYSQAVGGGKAIWEESQPNISVNAGRFSVLLGSRTELPAAPNFNITLYLGITVDDGNPATADVEMRPRQAIVPVISASYAKLAQNSEKLNGFDWRALFGANNPNGTILGSKISAGTITSNQLAVQTITADRIVSGTVTAAQIAPATITRNQLANGVIDVSALVQQVAEALVPVGSITSFGGPAEKIPAGWLLCDGGAKQRADYPALFAAIGTAWGNEQTTDFRVPDLRGVFLRGVNRERSGPFSDPETNERPAGAPNGNSGNLVGSYQNDDFKNHGHLMNGYAWLGGGEQRGSFRDGDTIGLNRITGSNTGGTETRPKNAYVNYIIKY